MGGSLLDGLEYTGGLHNILRTAFAPGDLLRLHACIYADFLSVHNQFTIFCFNVSLELAMYGIIAEHVRHIVQINERIINADYFNIRVAQRGTENQASNPTKSINTNFYFHIITSYRFITFSVLIL